MRALLVTDESFARRERDLLARVEVGLADEGVRVARADPAMDAPTYSGPFTERLTYPARTPLLTTPGRAARTLRELVNRRFIESEEALDVVHAWGRGAWTLALAIARRCGAPLVLEYASTQWSGPLRRLVRAADHGDEPLPLLCLCPTEPLRAEAHTVDPQGRAAFVPWGVHAAAQRAATLADPKDNVSFTIAATGRDPRGVMAALEGVARAIRPEQEALFFLDEAAVRRDTSVWRHARTLGMLDRMSVIADLEGRRSLVLRTDVFIQPEAIGELRSITLDAMGSGMLVLALEDRHDDVLIDRVTARLIPRAASDAWRDAVRWAVEQRQEAADLAAASQRWVRDHRKGSEQIRLLLESYERVAAGGTRPLVVR